MEGRKQLGSSSSSSPSLTSELFGSIDFHPSSASSGIFDSIFSPSSKVFGRESLRSALNGKNATEGSNSKTVTQDYMSKGSEGETENKTNKDVSYVYQEQRVQPCQLSSSIYYGGQDVYSHPQSMRGSESNTMMVEKMIQEVPQEETGGKDLSIIKRSHTCQEKYAPQGK